MMIVDSQFLHVYGFNFTGLDIAKSRSFGVDQQEREAGRRRRTSCSRPTSIASRTRPATSASSSARRTRASGSPRFIKGARKQLLIYDPQVDRRCDAAAGHRADQGRRRRPDHRQGRSEVGRSIKNEKYPGKRLHVRAIIRDGKRAFIGSQSLRRLELEKRREVGVIVTDESGRQADAGGLRAGLGADAERARRSGRRKRSGEKRQKTEKRAEAGEGLVAQLTRSRRRLACRALPAAIARSPSSRRGGRSRPCSTARTTSASRTRGGCRRSCSDSSGTPG